MGLSFSMPKSGFLPCIFGLLLSVNLPMHKFLRVAANINLTIMSLRKGRDNVWQYLMALKGCLMAMAK